jgi:hypothetical protein
VTPLLTQAEQVFTVARRGSEDCELAILIGAAGAIHILPAAGWELDSLRRSHGADTAYRVRRRGTDILVEARSAETSCLLRANRPEAALRPPLRDLPQYRLVP